MVILRRNWAIVPPKFFYPSLGFESLQKLEDPKLKEVKKFLDESKDGFMFFSLGSVVTPSILPPKTFEKLYAAFSKFNFRVLMRWKGAAMLEKPAGNILLTDKFLPQLEILSEKLLNLTLQFQAFLIRTVIEILQYLIFLMKF